MLTSHVVLPPTELVLAGLDPEQLCQKLAKHDDSPDRWFDVTSAR
jgi:hypothetical protein